MSLTALTRTAVVLSTALSVIGMSTVASVGLSGSASADTGRTLAAGSGSTFHVTVKRCDGPGSITDAIAKANAHPGADTISIDVPELAFYFKVGDCSGRYQPPGQHALTGQNHQAVMRITDSVTIEGNNAVLLTDAMWINQDGRVNRANAGRCPFGGTSKDLAISFSMGMVEVGAYGADNSNVTVTLRDLSTRSQAEHGGFEFLARIHDQSSLIIEGLTASEMSNPFNCGSAFFDVGTGANLTIRSSEFSNGINLGANLGGNSFITGGPSAGNLTIRDSIFYNLQNNSAVLWGGTASSRVNIISSRFQGAGGIKLHNSSSVQGRMEASLVNSIVQLSSPFLPSDLDAGDQILVEQYGTQGSTRLTIAGSSIGTYNTSCQTSDSSGQCNRAMPAVVAASGRGSSIRLEHTAIGVMKPTYADNNMLLVARTSDSTITADEYTWITSTNNEDTATLKKVVGTDALLYPPVEGTWRQGFLAGTTGITPLLTGALVDAIPFASGTPVPEPNALLDPVTGDPILKDALGNPRWDVTGASTIGAIQIMAAARLSLAGTGDSSVDLSWTQAPDPNVLAPVTGYQVDYRPVAGGPTTSVTFTGKNSLSGRITVLTNGVPYRFTVRPLSILGPGPLSNVVRATPFASVLSPAVSAVPAGDGTLRLSWTEPDLGGHPGPPTYTVVMRPKGSATWTAVRDTVSARSVQVPGLTNGKTYEFGVTATAIDGASSARPGLAEGTPAMPPALSYPTPLTVNQGEPLAVTASVSSIAGTASYAVSTGTLPPGLSLDAASGAITGTPLNRGQWDVTIRVTDSGTGLTAEAPLDITVIRPMPNPWLSYPRLITSVGQGAVSVTPTFSGVGAGARWSIASGVLPMGLALDSATGIISGRPVAPSGRFVAVTIAASWGGTKVQGVFTAAILPTLSYRSSVTSEIGASVNVNPTVVTWPGGVFSVDPTSSLPVGIVLDPATGELSGTPGREGTFPVTVRYSTGLPAPDIQDVSSNTVVFVITPAAISPTLSYPSRVRTEVDAPLAVPATVGSLTGQPEFTVASGALPKGMSLDPDSGSIVGIPTRSGSFSVVIRVRDRATGLTATAAIEIVVSTTDRNPALYYPDVTTSVGGRVAMMPTVTGVKEPRVNFSITDGRLPSGLRLDPSTGKVVGSPKRPTGSVVSLTIAATWNGGLVQGPVDIAVLPSLSYRPSSEGTVGQRFSLSPRVVTWPGGRFSLAHGDVLPSGLSLETTTGKIVGVPSTPSVVTVTVTYTTGLFSPQPIAVHSNPVTIAISTPALPPRVSYPSPASGTKGDLLTIIPTVSGLVGQARFAVTSGSLNDGLSINTSTGVISGTPLTVGDETVTVRLTDLGTGLRASSEVRIVVQKPGGPARVSYPTLVTAVDLGPVSVVPVVTGFTGRTTFRITDGDLPDGLTLDAHTGVISGTPTSPTGPAVRVRIRATANGTSAVGTVHLAILPVIAYSHVNHLVLGKSAEITSATTLWSGGRFSLDAGSRLPAGLDLDERTGVISGVPTQRGRVVATIRYSTGLDSPEPTFVEQRVVFVTAEPVPCAINVQSLSPSIRLPERTRVDVISYSMAGEGCAFAGGAARSAITVSCRTAPTRGRGDATSCWYVVHRNGGVSVRTTRDATDVTVTITVVPTDPAGRYTPMTWSATWHS